MANLDFISVNSNDETLIQKIETARKDIDNQLNCSAIAAKYDSQHDQIIIQFSDRSEFRFSSQLESVPKENIKEKRDRQQERSNLK